MKTNGRIDLGTGGSRGIDKAVASITSTRKLGAMPSVRVFPNTRSDRLHYRANLVTRDGVNTSAEGNFCFHLPIAPCGAY